MEKTSGAACGCGGQIIFKKNVKTSNYSYKMTKEDGFSADTIISLSACDEEGAK